MERMKWIAKWLLSWAVYVVVFSVSGMLFPVSEAIMAKVGTADAKFMMLALAVVTLCESLLLNYVVSSARVTGLRLMGALLVLTWGIQTFMTQIETLVFIKAFPDLDTVGVLRIMLSSFLVYLAAIPFIMLIQGKWKGTLSNPASTSPVAAAPALKSRWYFWLPVISIAYVVLYFSFGLFPISFPETKAYYGAWIASLSSISPWTLGGIQIVRGLLWTLCILPLFFILEGSKEKKMVTAAVVMGVFTAFQLMYPNGLMPPIVRFGHFVELFSEMMIFGALVGALVIPEDPYISRPVFVR